MLEFIETKNAPAAIGPYSQATKASGVLLVSGQLPINPESGELVTDIREATKRSLENVLAIVEGAGLKLENIARVGVFVKDIGQFGEINEVYADFFKDHKPARALVEVSKLPKDAVIEIEATCLY
ncbi:Rid family detoxifying hydrolase [Citroniella saccharovorans]|uniref:Rid family detoxifying hydrolase n=1 Tax=Citroniella saccharovorans TaxID=2053367 RepID=A0AAW9MWF5_9FIRM|nr:Rid family detoxifying hydrolase [Citroniella saccharovorans]MEB3429939.1 Rid family detoxifying hydrolase [Citroniella saccharovorans]